MIAGVFGVERCLACEAVVNKETTSRNTLCACRAQSSTVSASEAVPTVLTNRPRKRGSAPFRRFTHNFVLDQFLRFLGRRGDFGHGSQHKPLIVNA